MGRLHVHPNKIVKVCGSKLQVRVKKIGQRPCPCPSNCKSSAALHITFFTHTRKRYLDSSSRLVGAEQETTGENIICVDSSLFFDGNHAIKHYVSEVLESLNVEKYLHDRIVGLMMSLGEHKNNNKILNGLVVDLLFVQTFLGDEASVRELFEDSMEEYGSENSEKGVHFVP